MEQNSDREVMDLWSAAAHVSAFICIFSVFAIGLAAGSAAWIGWFCEWME